MAEEPTLLLTRHEGPVLTLTLNRPQALNSFTGDLHDALLTALSDAANDRSVRCVVLTGAGRGFCAGQDLSDPAIAPDLTPGATPKDIGALIEATAELVFDELAQRGFDLRVLIERRTPVAHHLLHRRLVADAKAVRAHLANEVGAVLEWI